MRVFVDTADSDQITDVMSYGFVSGITTNPSLIAKTGKSFPAAVADILATAPDATVLIEAVGTDTGSLIDEARALAAHSDRVVVKVPATPYALEAVRALSSEGIQTTVTLVFSVNQAIAAACAGASFVAPFVGRLDDIDDDGIERVRTIGEVFAIHGVATQIISASIRSAGKVSELFLAGSHVVTLPVEVIKSMVTHPLTDSGLDRFETDWRSVPVA